MKTNIKQIQIVDYVKHSRSILMVLATVFAANSAMAATSYLGTGGATVSSCNSTTLGSGSAITVNAAWCQNVAPTNPSHTILKSDGGYTNGLLAANGTCTYSATCETGYDGTNLTAYNPSCVVHNYTITYTNAKSSWGTMTNSNPTTYNKESATITLADPTMNYYTFAGWTGSNGSTAQKGVKITQGSTGDKTYTATWTPITYTISYTLNGGALASGDTNPTSYTYESAAITLKNPTQAGYTFAGWCTNSALTSGCSTSVTISAKSNGNKTYYAKWTKALTYKNGDTTVSSTTCVLDKTITLPATPTKEGYTFAGWTVNK